MQKSTLKIMTDPSPIHTYANAGTYDVKLVMTYSGGPCGEGTCVDTFSMRVPVRSNCNAVFVVNYDPGQSYVELTDYSYTNCPSGISMWIVDWGDGTMDTFFSAPMNVVHDYSNAGIYRVIMTVKDQCGNSSVKEYRVHVNSLCCRPVFTQKDRFYFGNGKYYLKAKFIIRGNLGNLSHVAAKSVLYKKRRGRYVRARATTIRAGFAGYVWINDCSQTDGVYRSKVRHNRASVTVTQYKPYRWWYGIRVKYRNVFGSHYVFVNGKSTSVNWSLHDIPFVC